MIQHSNQMIILSLTKLRYSQCHNHFNCVTEFYTSVSSLSEMRQLRIMRSFRHFSELYTVWRGLIEAIKMLRSTYKIIGTLLKFDGRKPVFIFTAPPSVIVFLFRGRSKIHHYPLQDILPLKAC